MNLIKKCIAEFIGTFAIVLGGCGAIIANQISDGSIGHAGIAATFGLIVMTMVYAVGHISGAHFNPAVTVSFAINRHFPIKEIIPYIVSQCAGAVSASFIHLTFLVPVYKGVHLANFNIGTTMPFDQSMVTAIVWEVLLTFFLMFVIMAVATDYRAVGQMAGLAIGGTVMFDALFGGPISGASMNPARSFGPALVSGQWQFFGAYVLGPIVGAILGGFVYNFIRCEPQDSKEVKGCC